MPADHAAAKAVFLDALAIDDPAARAALVNERCGTDAELRARVEALLAANDRARAGEGTATFGGEGEGDAEPTADYPGRDEHAGAVIAGKYALVEPIGEGGMGAVWRAKQTEPVKRFVAVKLIKAGMDSKTVLTRFEAERQALALMDHPNIAKVFDGGLHAGRPFFVMELVKGVPITAYCDANRLTPHHRLELFVQACLAIQHAHQKGIIHRDIKPSNVLVARYDDRPVVKVIDFGVAKATGAALTDRTLDTGFGGVVGTPQYMSPEQATFNNLDIDTRSDVYALGVLLYELLTGSPPFARPELEKRGLLEILRVVREEEPPRPSTKLSSSAALPSLSADRGTEPKKLTGLLRNELDWVVMKALEKDRTRRYETANGFAADVQRYLAGEAVLAHPPSRGYRVRKFVRRNRGQVVAAGVVAGALVAGVVGTTVGLVEARRQTAIARDQEAEAVKQAGVARDEAAAKESARAAEARQREVAEAEKRRADEEKQVAQAVNDFLQTKLLAQAATKAQADALLRAGGVAAEAKLNPTVRELLDRAAKELAADTIEANFPNQPLVQAEILRTVGEAYRGVGEAATGTPYLARSVALLTAKLGPDHHDTLSGMSNLASGYRDAGQLDKALPLLEETLTRAKAKLGPDDPDTLSAMGNLAGGYQDAGKVDKALPLLEETLTRMTAKLGPDHPHTLVSMGALAAGYQDAGKLDKALPLYEETLTRMKAKLGPDHSDTLAAMNNLAVGYTHTGKLDLALPLLVETLKLRTAKLGPDHPKTRTTEQQVTLLRRQSSADERYRRELAANGPKHINTLLALRDLADFHTTTGQLDRAEPQLGEVLAGLTVGPDDPVRASTVGLVRKCLAAREAREPDAWTTFNTCSLLGGALMGQKKYAEAEPLLLKGYEGMKARETTIPKAGGTRIPESLDRLIELYDALKKPDEVTKYRGLRAEYPRPKDVAPMPRERK